jgi:hypothetical protein
MILFVIIKMTPVGNSDKDADLNWNFSKAIAPFVAVLEGFAGGIAWMYREGLVRICRRAL